MKNSFTDQFIRKVREEVNGFMHVNKDSRSQQVPPPSGASAAPQYYYEPASNSPSVNPYSHTANSTAGYSQTVAYPRLPSQNQGSEAKSIIEKTESIATSLLGNVVGQDNIAAATHKINSVIANGPCARDHLQNFATVQLVSKNSGRLLQILMSQNGTLVFDGNGAPNGFNTHFIVELVEQGRVRFHNNYNYLAFEGKQACVMSFPPGVKNNLSIDFRVHDIIGARNFVAFESCACKNHFISILPDGNIKTTHIKDKTIEAQFSIVPIMNNPQPLYPYQGQSSNHQHNMNPNGGFKPSGVNQPRPSQTAIYQEQAVPSAPPPPSYDESVYNQSSGLYPKF